MNRYLPLLLVSTALAAAEPSPPPCQLIQPEKLIVNEDGSQELAATSVKFHGEWSLKDGIICGVHGNEKHIATLKFVRPFEDCVLKFRVRFVDPGNFIFVGGGHGVDVAFSAGRPASTHPIKLKGRKPGQAPEAKAEVLATSEKVFPVGEWIDVLIEHSGDRLRAKIGDAEIEAAGGFRASGNPKAVFYLNAGDKPGTRVEFDDIHCWSGTPLKK